MRLDEYHELCGSLAATSFVVQWGDAHVWKVGGKVFAMARDGDEPDHIIVTFKVDPDEYEFLARMPGLRPAPYLASRGLTWIQQFERPGLDDDDLTEQILESYRLVASGLSRKRRLELGIET